MEVLAKNRLRRKSWCKRAVPFPFLVFGKVDKDKLLFMCGVTNRLRAAEPPGFDFIRFSVGDFGTQERFKGQ